MVSNFYSLKKYFGRGRKERDSFAPIMYPDGYNYRMEHTGNENNFYI